MSNPQSEKHRIQTELQRKTFTKWASSVTVKSGNKPINDIVLDFKNGLSLIDLLNSIQSKAKDGSVDSKRRGPLPYKEPNPNNTFKCYANLNTAIDAIMQDGARLVNIGAEDVFNQDEKLILGLVWTLLCHYEAGSDGGQLSKTLKEFVNSILAQHPDFGVPAIDSFSDPQICDGRVFKVLNHHFNQEDDAKLKSLSPFQKSPSDKVAHFDESLNDGEKTLDITKLIDGADMNNPAVSPDEKSVMAQVIQYKSIMGRQNESDLLKEQLGKKLAKNLENFDKAKEINRMIDGLLKWIDENTHKMNNNPEDLHPSGIEPMEKEVKQFNSEKPDKASESNKIFAEHQRLKQKTQAEKTTMPHTDIPKLIAAWKGLSIAERGHLDFLKKMKSNYALLFSRKRQFDRKHTNLKNFCTSIDTDINNNKQTLAGPISHQVMDAAVTNMKIIGLNSNESKDLRSELENFMNAEITPNCPSKAFLQSEFIDPLKQLESDSSARDKKIAELDEDYKKANDKFNKIKGNLTANEGKLEQLRRKIDESQTVADSVEPFKNHQDFDAEQLEVSSIDIGAFKKDLQDCEKRDQENTQIMGSEVPNPYTQTTTGQIQDKLSTLEKALDAKKSMMATEKERMDALKNRQNQFENSKNRINQNIEKINDQIANVNQATNNDAVLVNLNKCKEEVEVIIPEVQGLSNKYSDDSEILAECHILSAEVTALNSKITDQIEIVSSKPVHDEVDYSLTSDEVKKIETEFKSKDANNSKKLSYQSFHALVVNFPFLGLKNLNESSPEIREFYKQFGSAAGSGETISLEQIKRGYAEKKERFMVQSKDQVTALLTKHATEQNTISQDKLKSLIPSSVFAKISEKLTPVDVNGEKHYSMQDLLWTFIAAAAVFIHNRLF